ncbi:MAG: OprD family outer membrane porin [Sulfurimonas sp.]|uniref:OprD family outer membrane porin n=1 Tax=Sulfurimonas sp. TaxID=2022749 RepID=UPI0026342797|nr:OprD family outer membrane porin [Sulfurimonas sp.]MCW8895782.1 OprD family outer membrane porin [Sulfurimonas sp.]MCW8954593.1 OprD family outer membrane porin [Sulfurimonas sp.]MCW9067491.1 OprD family outer membrane porin [Sulfurimonas sp.]
MNNLVKALLVTVVLYSPLSLSADDVKSSIKANGMPVYFDKPGLADSFKDMFREGKFYGRLRNNNFYHRWAKEDADHTDHMINGFGVSLVYNSAEFLDFDFGVGLYSSTAIFDDNKVPTSHLKPGKDLISRYDYENDGDKYMAVLGQAYVKYSGIDDTDIILGRQLVESFYVHSNDTKMIPNTFDGVLVQTNVMPDTNLQVAYLVKQKLRDHTKTHSVLMYDDTNVAEFSNWNANDDSAMHKGLSYTALKAAGKPTDAPLILADFKNKSIDNLKIDGSFYTVPELLSQGMLELNYKYKFDGFSLSPGFRYINQFDNGAGSVGGASLSGLSNTAGYKDPTSLDSQMIAARLVAKKDAYKINLGYSYILDEADLVTPWRGFPTAGYTRSMGIYNWFANTKSYRLEVVRNTNKTAVYRDPFVQASVLYIDGDEDKISAKDELYYYLGVIQNIPSFPSLQYKLRLGYAQFMDSVDNDFNYLDSRFELNYMF